MSTQTPTANMVTIKGLKTWRTDDGGGWQATLVIDGHEVGTVTDHGSGGPVEWRLQPYEQFDVELFAAWAATFGVTIIGNAVPYDSALDSEIARLIDVELNDRRFARLSKTKTIFRLPTDADGEWRTITAPISDKVRAYLSKTHPTAILWTREVAR